MNINQHEEGFSIVEILLVTLVVSVLGFGGYWVYSQNNKDESASTNLSEPTDNDEVANGSSIVESVFVGSTVTATLSHPSGWIVDKYDYSDDVNWADGTTWPKLEITSNKGNSIKFIEGGGLGGTCDRNADTYTLEHRITTQNQNIVFSEYSHEKSDSPGIAGQLVLEEWSSDDYPPAEHKALREGDSSTDTCYTNILPSFRGDHVFMKNLNSTNENDEYNNLSYADIVDDQEFIDMLESLNVTP